MGFLDGKLSDAALAALRVELERPWLSGAVDAVSVECVRLGTAHGSSPGTEDGALRGEGHGVRARRRGHHDRRVDARA
jgi:hypothetical protein